MTHAGLLGQDIEKPMRTLPPWATGRHQYPLADRRCKRLVNRNRRLIGEAAEHGYRWSSCQQVR